MKEKPTRKYIYRGVQLLLLLFCTIVGCYGIATAPESDCSTLKQELEENAKILEKADANTSNQIFE